MDFGDFPDDFEHRSSYRDRQLTDLRFGGFATASSTDGFPVYNSPNPSMTLTPLAKPSVLFSRTIDGVLGYRDLCLNLSKTISCEKVSIVTASRTFHGFSDQNLSHHAFDGSSSGSQHSSQLGVSMGGYTSGNEGDRPLGLLELFIPRVDESITTDDGIEDDPPSLLFWMVRIYGSVNLMATDEFGSQFLRQFLDRATFRETVTIFCLVFYHFIQLATDPFGNVFVHKLLDLCNAEEKTQILIMLISKPKRRMVKISVNTYGRRVVQKLIEAVRTKIQMIRLMQSALNPGFLSLVRGLNGYHVIQRFLRPLNHSLIFEAATRLCTEIGTHRHGCCVLQRCVSYSVGADREKLVAAISRNCLLLAQDPFGNHLVQYIVEQKVQGLNLLFELRGKYVELATHKFSSHVVEKYLRYYPESRSEIVRELTYVPNFEHLLRDPFANYVIQSALSVTEGVVRETLVEKVGAYGKLKTSPYCKRISLQESLEDVT